MLVSMKAVLDLADAKKIAVGAFNITSLEGIQAVLGAAESWDSRLSCSLRRSMSPLSLLRSSGR